MTSTEPNSTTNPPLETKDGEDGRATTTATTTIMTAATPARAATLAGNLSAVATRVAASSSSVTPARTRPVRLVAVSKLKPISDILALAAPPASHRHFGENYVQELLEKSRLVPPTEPGSADSKKLRIRWHFIGGLQSNKCVALARDVKNLWAVESVDTEKKASLLDKGWSERKRQQQQPVEDMEDDGEEENNEKRLRVFVQVNTSGEENKAGVEPAEATALCRFIRETCTHLKLQGLMTIGAIARSKATTPETENEDFLTLRKARDTVVQELGLSGEEAYLELSMGMSEDFEGAIALGSDEVRVGTTIFGERPPKSHAKVVA